MSKDGVLEVTQDGWRGQNQPTPSVKIEKEIQERKESMRQDAVDDPPLMRKRPRRGEGTKQGKAPICISQTILQSQLLESRGDKALGCSLRNLGWSCKGQQSMVWVSGEQKFVDVLIWRREVPKQDREEGITQISGDEAIGKLMMQYKDDKFIHDKSQHHLLGKTIHLKCLVYMRRRPNKKEIRFLALTEQDLEPFKDLP